jgi:hypothetical protein
MRVLTSFVTVFAVLVISACGGSDDTPTRTQVSPFATITATQGTNRIGIDPPRRRPPRSLRIKDIEVGTGPVAQHGDNVAVHYKGVNYRTGKVVAHTWPPTRPLQLRLGLTGWGDQWEKGIEGMRVGGRRELIARLPEGPVIDYVVDLVRVQPSRTAGAGD